MQHLTRMLLRYTSALLLCAGCAGGDGRAPAPAALDEDVPDQLHQVAIDPCANHDTGCPCEEEGASVNCGTITEQRGSYTICSMGTRICSEGQWSECAIHDELSPGAETTEVVGGEESQSQP